MFLIIIDTVRFILLQKVVLMEILDQQRRLTVNNW